jgi:hypothetical protein
LFAIIPPTLAAAMTSMSGIARSISSCVSTEENKLVSSLLDSIISKSASLFLRILDMELPTRPLLPTTNTLIMYSSFIKITF